MLTLVVVPVLFTYVDGFWRGVVGLFTGESARRRKLRPVSSKKKKQKPIRVVK
jgi:hypothetical protein